MKNFKDFGNDTKYHININLYDKNTRTSKAKDSEGNSWAIYKGINIYDFNIDFESKEWLMSKYVEDENSSVMPIGDIKKFDSLQKAFNIADEMGLSFL